MLILHCHQLHTFAQRHKPALVCSPFAAMEYFDASNNQLTSLSQVRTSASWCRGRLSLSILPVVLAFMLIIAGMHSRSCLQLASTSNSMLQVVLLSNVSSCCCSFSASVPE